jgi:hypothetical protein
MTREEWVAAWADHIIAVHGFCVGCAQTLANDMADDVIPAVRYCSVSGTTLLAEHRDPLPAWTVRKVSMWDIHLAGRVKAVH